MEKHNFDRLILFSIVFGVLIFYLPFVCRQFMGDDWLWLANAKAALGNPRLFLERPMYGYFRPLNLLWVFVLYNLIGAKAYVFSIFSILLHTANVILFSKVLTDFNIKRPIKEISTIFFAFYFLNISAIGWISVGHDLWVVLLTLLFTLRMFKFIEKPKIAIFIQVIILGLAATLFKEAGFITAGLYLLMLFVYNKNPFSGKYRLYTLIIGSVYSAYLILYFATRTYADREVVFNFHALINLWYFLAYLVTPFSERIIKSVPSDFYWLFKLVKIAAVILVPLILGYIFWKREKILMYFSLWSVMFLSTVAVFDWRLKLLDLYPDRTASRFMYIAIPGAALVAAWLIVEFYALLTKKPIRIEILALMAICFIMGNWFIIRNVSGIFISNQKEINQIIADLKPLVPELKDTGKLYILTDNLDKTPQIVYSRIHLEAILFIQYGISTDVLIREAHSGNISLYGNDSDTTFALWDTSLGRFVSIEDMN